MSSVDQETPELKAGHPPAVKVGGMRVAQHKPPTHNNNVEKPAPAADGDEEGNDEEVTTEVKQKEPQMIISGAVANEKNDFPTQAVKAFHEKPNTPNHAYAIRDQGRMKPNIVQQPRRQN